MTYSWTDGDGQLLSLNHVESTAVKIVRPPRCRQSTHALHPGSGRGSYQFGFSYPGPNGPWLIAGLSLPFDHPERVRVGVQIETGGNCGPVETVTASQWVTLVPSTAPASAPTTSSPQPTTTAS